MGFDGTLGVHIRWEVSISSEYDNLTWIIYVLITHFKHLLIFKLFSTRALTRFLQISFPRQIILGPSQRDTKHRSFIHSTSCSCCGSYRTLIVDASISIISSFWVILSVRACCPFSIQIFRDFGFSYLLLSVVGLFLLDYCIWYLDWKCLLQLHLLLQLFPIIWDWCEWWMFNYFVNLVLY